MDNQCPVFTPKTNCDSCQKLVPVTDLKRDYLMEFSCRPCRDLQAFFLGADVNIVTPMEGYGEPS